MSNEVTRVALSLRRRCAPAEVERVSCQRAFGLVPQSRPSNTLVVGIAAAPFGSIIGMLAFANANDTGGPILFGLAWAVVALVIRRHAPLSNNPASGA